MQKTLLEELQTSRIENALKYNQVRFDKREWDNVAPIVPRFLMYLEKYIEGLSEKCHEFNEREHVKDLRADMTQRIKEVNEQIEENRDTDLVEKSHINDEKIEINRKIKLFKKDYEEFRSKATALDQSDCYNDFEKVMLAVMESKKTGNPVKNSDDGGEIERQ